MTWLDANADGIALAVVIGILGVLLLVGALCVERLVEPRHERKHRHMTAVNRARDQRRREVAS
jgi:hypothetical protein